MSWLLQLLDKNSPNPSTRLELCEEIIDQLSHNRLPSDSKVLNNFCDAVFQWMGASNFKVSLQAIEVLHTALDISGDVLAPYLLERTPALVERLGDSKPQVRDAVTNLLIDLAAVPHCSHQAVLDKISTGFSNKQWLVKCGTMNVYRLLLDEARDELEIQTNRLIPVLCKLMSDPNNDVRENSMNTVVHIMVVLGETTALSIRNRRLIPEAKMQLLMQRYEDALRRGSVPSAVARPIRVQRRFEPRAQSASASRNGFNGSPAGRQYGREEQENIGIRRPVTMAKKAISTPSRTGPAGAVTEDEIRKSFGDVPKTQVTSKADVHSHLEEARTVLEKTDIDWSKRNNSLKIIRAVVSNGGLDFENDLISALLLLENALVKSVTDLRSQVCKEACITVCFLAERLGMKLSPLFEKIFPNCIPLIQNSAKVMASSSRQACDFIVKNVQTPRILQCILDSISHKSKDIRAHCHYLLLLALTDWPPQKLEKHMKDLVNAIKYGILDADPTARRNGKETYQQLEIVFPAQAQALFKTLDPSKQKALSGSGSAASSAQSIHSLRDGLQMTKRPGSSGLSRPSAFLSGRSASAIDTFSARNASINSPKTSYNLAQRTPVRPMTGSAFRTPASTSMAKSRPAPLKTYASNSSQPSSRTASPTRITPKPPSYPQRPSTTASSHANNGFRNDDSDEIFAKINNLALQSGEDEDFLLGTGTSSTETQLNTVLKKLYSQDASEKKEALIMLQDLLRAPKRISESDIKKVSEAIMKLIVEANHKFLNILCDTLSELVQRYPSYFSQQQIQTLICRLISKSSQELIPSNQVLWKRMLDVVRDSFKHDVLLLAVCKNIEGSMTTPQTAKARTLVVQYLADLVEVLEAGVRIDKNEALTCALTKIFQWLEDPKNHDIRQYFEKLMNALFTFNAADFATLLNNFKTEWKQLAYQFCNKSNGRREVESTPPRREYSMPLTGIDTPDHFKKNPSLGPILNLSFDNDANRSNLDDTAFLAYDESQQAQYIKKQLNELAHAKTQPDRQEEQILAMQQLLQMVSEGSFTTWDAHFKSLIVQLFDILSLDNTKVKKEALRLLTKLCTVQASRFYDFGQVTVTKVLNTTVNEKDSWFLNVVDDCLKTLASHLPIQLILSTLNPIINNKVDQRVTFALKMVQRMVEAWDSEHISQYLEEFVPGVIECYNNVESSVRKNTIFCLTTLVNKLGREVMDKYLENLDPKGFKLLTVYLQRNQTASTHF